MYLAAACPLLLQESQYLLLIFEDCIQAGLVLLDDFLIFHDGFLIGDDRVLIGENGFLV